MVKAVRKSGIVFQTGTQQRSSDKFRLACELVRNGRIGRLDQITVWLPAGLREGPFFPSPPPQGLNWDFWLGQAPKVDYVTQRCHLLFRYWYDYAGGTMTDWGAHHNDIARWAVDLAGPVSVEGKPLAEPIPGGYTAFSDYEVNYTYANGVRHTVRATHNDSIYGGGVKEDGQHNGISLKGATAGFGSVRAELQASDDALISTPLPPPPNVFTSATITWAISLTASVRASCRWPTWKRDRPLRSAISASYFCPAPAPEITMESGAGSFYPGRGPKRPSMARPKNAQALRLQFCGP